MIVPSIFHYDIPDISNGVGLDPTSPSGPLGRPHMSPQGLLVCLLATKRSAQPKVHLTSATKPPAGAQKTGGTWGYILYLHLDVC